MSRSIRVDAPPKKHDQKVVESKCGQADADFFKKRRTPSFSVTGQFAKLCATSIAVRHASNTSRNYSVSISANTSQEKSNFASDSSVLTRLVPIESIQLGDNVWAWDEMLKTHVGKRVTRLFLTPDQPIYLVNYVDSSGVLAFVRATGEHPFWVRDRGWVPLHQLQQGDLLQLRNNNTVTVSSVIASEVREDVFNFEVEGLHNYFVGEDGVLVHNSSILVSSELSMDEKRSLLDMAVSRARQGIVADAQESLDAQQALSYENLGGFCGPTQGWVANILEPILLPKGGQVIMLASHSDSDVTTRGSKLISSDTAHFFTVVKMPDGELHLVDPTFPQFLQKDSGSNSFAENPFAKRLFAHEKGMLVVRALANEGHILLTPEVAQIYGSAITGRIEEFFPHDFETSNTVVDKRRTAIALDMRNKGYFDKAGIELVKLRQNDKSTAYAYRSDVVLSDFEAADTLRPEQLQPTITTEPRGVDPLNQTVSQVQRSAGFGWFSDDVQGGYERAKWIGFQTQGDHVTRAEAFFATASEIPGFSIDRFEGLFGEVVFTGGKGPALIFAQTGAYRGKSRQVLDGVAEGLVRVKYFNNPELIKIVEWARDPTVGTEQSLLPPAFEPLEMYVFGHHMRPSYATDDAINLHLPINETPTPRHLIGSEQPLPQQSDYVPFPSDFTSPDFDLGHEQIPGEPWHRERAFGEQRVLEQIDRAMNPTVAFASASSRARFIAGAGIGITVAGLTGKALMMPSSRQPVANEASQHPLAERGSLTYQQMMLGKSIPIVIFGKQESWRTEYQKKLNGAFDELNAQQKQLSSEDVRIIHLLQGITIDENKLTGVRWESGIYNMKPGYLFDSSPSWVASTIAHDAFHLDQRDRGLRYSKNTAHSMERDANIFQHKVGRFLGLSPAELGHIDADTHTYWNTDEY